MIIIENGTRFQVTNTPTGMEVRILQEKTVQKPVQVDTASEKKVFKKKSKKAGRGTKSPQWTSEEDSFLSSNMYIMKLDELSRELGRSEDAISYRLYTKHGYKAKKSIDSGLANLGQVQEAEVIE